MERNGVNGGALIQMRELASACNVCILITTEAQGGRRNRPVGAIEIDDAGNCWFFASRSSGKIKDISTNNKIQLVFANPDFDHYLEIHGTGIVVDDKAEIACRWCPLVNEWFRGGMHDPEVVLVRIDVTSVFYWDTTVAAIRRLAVKQVETAEQQRLAA
ncbi:MAG TPA: pyridoxamine 5'-phosphate oxidase family protein [Chitinophagaceae bacterium]